MQQTSQEKEILEKLEEGVSLQFPEGLYGFEDQKSFLLKIDKEKVHFLRLENKDVAFILIDPYLFSDASLLPILSKQDLKKLDVNDSKECLIYSIVTIPKDNPKEMTANLQGPIVTNPNTKRAYQFISLQEGKLLRIKVLEQIKQKEA